MFELAKIIGLKVLTIKSIAPFGNNPDFILFDDGETYIKLEEQDYYSFHDCATSARHFRLHIAQPEFWEILLSYPNASCDL